MQATLQSGVRKAFAFSPGETGNLGDPGSRHLPLQRHLSPTEPIS